MNQFVTDRDEAQRSLNREVIEKFYKKYKIPCPIADRLFWREVHRARVSNPNLTEEEKNYSLKWLHSHGCGRGQVFKGISF